MTPHSGGRSWGRYVPSFLTIAEGRAGHAMWPASTVPLVTLQNAVFRTFPAFPAFSGFSGNSGGPSLHFEQEWPGEVEVARMATFAVLAIPGTLGTPGSRPSRTVWEPYSWPPESARPGRFRIPGGHTARFTGSDGSGFSEKSDNFSQKRVRRQLKSGLHTAQSCSK